MDASEKVGYFQSWKRKLLFLLMAAALIPLLISSVVSYWQASDALQKSVTANLEGSLTVQAAALNDWLLERVNLVSLMAASEPVQSMDPQKIDTYLRAAMNQYKFYDSLYVMGPDGKEIFDTDFKLEEKDKLADLSQREYFQKAFAGETYIAEPFVSKTSGNLIMSFAVPIKSKDGKIIGVMASALIPKTFAEKMKAMEIGDTGEAYLINQNGFLLTPSRFTEDLKKANKIKDRTVLELKVEHSAAQAVLANNSGSDTYVSFRNTKVVGAYEPIQVLNAKWGIIYEMDEAEAYKAVYQLQILYLIIALVVFFILLGVSFVVTRSFTGVIDRVSQAAFKLAHGDINQIINEKSRDELGLMASAMQKTIIYMRDMAQAAARLAEGDLTVQITPRSEEDLLGHSFVNMIKNLKTLVNEVQQNAQILDNASEHLSQSAANTEKASEQIVMTVQHVAQGASQQTEFITKTATSVDQMSRAIDGLAKGAQEQASAVSKTSSAMAQFTQTVENVNQGASMQAKQMALAANTNASMSQSIDSVTTATEQVAVETERTVRSAEDGTKIAQQSAKGMEQVQSATEELSVRIQDLGKRSGQIGAIIETIDDIAAQTNLLALNAAIEAARAGEHGKGFAVVADEVRKLAERSGQATKEISEMIRSIQNGANETVSAMQRAGQDVESAVELSEKAGEAFKLIAVGTRESSQRVSAIRVAVSEMQKSATQLAKAVQEASQVAERNQQASNTMSKLSQDISTSLDSVSAVVEENTAATEEMAASSSEVNQAIENIASVSEENSAAVEEVSASIEEMSAQVQEVNNSARRLANMAQKLKLAVAKFKLEK
jgi:methyl-accepting chemotaxis protein